jgi:energy-coupling factor transport system substrate-specific component
MDWTKSKKNFKKLLFIILCILINFTGRKTADHYSLPLWLDSIGTVWASYMLGPVCGSIVGITGNILHAFQNPVSCIYALTSLSIGVSVGCFAKYHFFDSFFWTTSVTAFVAVISTLISTVLNIIFYHGMTSNIWGDGVIGYLSENGFPRIVCYFVGQFYIDFLDKLITLLFLYLMFALVRNIRKLKVKKTMSAVLLICIAAGMTVRVNAQEGEPDLPKYEFTSYVQTVYSSENGLSCGEANDIAQTNDGILWIGTYAGLYRYNGREIKLMDYDSVKNVNCLYVDEEGRLWIGTNDNGLSICIDEDIVDVVDEEKGLPSNSVRCIVQSSDGYYYVGTSADMQVLSLDLEGDLKLQREVDVHYASSIAADGNGNVAAVDVNGNLYLLREQQILASMQMDVEQEQFNSCAFDENGLLYVGTSDNHIYVYDISRNGFKEKKIVNCGKLNNVNCMYFPEDGGMFVCTDSGIGYMDENNRFIEINTNQFDSSVDNMTIDYQGNLWFTSSRMGVLRLCKSKVTDFYSAVGLENKVVNTSELWNGLLYVGTDKGLDILDIGRGATVENDLTSLLKGIRIRCIRADSANTLWICTYGNGLWRYDGEAVTTYDAQSGTFGDRARVVIELQNGVIAAAGDTGISFIENGIVSKSIKYGEGLSNSLVLSLMERPDGTILAGTDGDGIALIVDGEVTGKLTRTDGLSSGVILRTVNDTAGNGTFIVTSNGLCYMEEDYTIRTLDNFPYYNNYDIWQTDDGKLFVLGSAGIYVVNRDEVISGQEVKYELLNTKEGLTSPLTANSWNSCADGRELYISCDSGVYGIDLQNYISNTGEYRMLLSSVKLDDVAYDMEYGTTLQVERDVSKIELFPEVINYTIEDPYLCYYLEGYETYPNIVLQSELSSVIYTNLPSGSYKFHLEVLGNDKKTVLQESVYSIEKAMEIYDHPWFIAYMILVMALFLCWFTWFVVRTQVQQTLSFQKKELELAKNQMQLVNQTIIAIARTVDAKDESTSRHSQRVSEYSVLIARELGMNNKECENLSKTALLHDIGKIGIADKVLNKPGRLTDEEYEIMKSHVVKGAEILKDFTGIDHVWEGALYHHERYDGKGYMAGLKGTQIPLNARIIAIADAFDAMTANRVYRNKLNFSYVLEELKKGRGTQFDPQLVDILLKLIEEGKINIEELYSDQRN